jgi:hypothetical protein
LPEKRNVDSSVDVDEEGSLGLDAADLEFAGIDASAIKVHLHYKLMCASILISSKC